MTTPPSGQKSVNNQSPDLKKQKGPQGQHLSKPKGKPKNSPRSARKTRTESMTEKFLTPSQGLTVWKKGWKCKALVEITKTKLTPFDEVFGESGSIHDAIKIRHKAGIPGKTGYIFNISFWKSLFLEGFDRKEVFGLDDESKSTVKRVAIRLALTSPSIFETHLWKDNVNLQAREDTAAWAAAQFILGTWRWDEKIIETTQKSGEPQNDSNDSNNDQNEENQNDQPKEMQTDDENNEIDHNQTGREDKPDDEDKNTATDATNNNNDNSSNNQTEQKGKEKSIGFNEILFTQNIGIHYTYKNSKSTKRKNHHL